MGRGLFSGVLWGSILSVMSLWLLSQIAQTVGFQSEPPRDVASISPTPGESDAAAVGETPIAPIAPDSQSSPATDPSRQGTGLDQAEAEAAPTTETTPAAVPQTPDIDVVQASPTQGDAPTIDAPTEAPAATGSEAVAPTAPAPEAPVAEPDAPAPQTQSTQAEAPQVPEIPVVVAQALPIPENTPVAQSEPAQPAIPASETVPESGISTPIVPETPDPLEETPEPAPEPEAPAETPDPANEPVPESDFSSPIEVETPAAPVVTPEPEAPAETPDPAPITGAAPVVVDRTSREPVADEPEQTGEDEAEAGEPEAETMPAIQRFAAEFDNPDGRPLMSIILLVDGDAPDAAQPGEPLPFPVSYVVDASKDNAREIMAAYRANGNEVALLAPLPEGAAPKDVEVAFQTYLAAVPEAVAVMDVPAAIFQSGRSVATQVAEALAANGLGMITYSRGLNSATQVAEREGVPAALVFRVFDDNDRDGAAIKRFLDQAAFRAGQQTGVILVGHNRPETVTALLEWGLGNRAGTVALAPVSVALLSNQ